MTSMYEKHASSPPTWRKIFKQNLGRGLHIGHHRLIKGEKGEKPPCKLCNDLNKKDIDDVRLAFDFTPNQLIQSSSEEGCAACAIILEGLRGYDAQSWSFEQDVRRIYAHCRSMRDRKPDSLSVELYFEDDRPKVELEFFSLDAKAWKAVLPRPSINGHPLSPRALAWVKSNLRECKEKHTLCKNSDAPVLPKRLLLIEPAPTMKDGLKVRLIENETVYAPYAAVSHCWGKEKMLVTTKATLQKHKTHIEWTLIPKTFRDVIRFALSLGIKYVWIDSLCIIQDDPSDWEVESSNMADVYQHSYLTLAATAATGDSRGCYSDQISVASAAEKHIRSSFKKSCRVAVRQSLQHWDTLVPSLVEDKYPLLSRAWVFQERLLSPRIVHFCNEELVWECRQTSTCECGGLGDHQSPGGEYHEILAKSMTGSTSESDAFTDLTNPFDSRVLRYEQDLSYYSQTMGSSLPESRYTEVRSNYIYDESVRQAAAQKLSHWQGFQQRYELVIQALKLEKEPSEVSRQWRKFVEQYSGLKITKTTDRLPALSGLCKRVKHLRGEYVAGLWVDSIWLDLLWRVNTVQSGLGQTQASRFQAPSWSWLSVKGSVSYWDDIKCLSLGPLSDNSSESDNSLQSALIAHELRRRPIYLDYYVQLAGENPFGEIASAVLVVKSYSRSALLRCSHDTRADGDHVHDPFKYRVEVDDIDVPFYADSALGDTGLLGTRNLLTVTLLVIHPQIALVLVPQTFKSRRPIFSNGLKEFLAKSPSENDLWGRIGIVRISDAVLNLYGTDWMREAFIKQFHIV